MTLNEVVDDVVSRLSNEDVAVIKRQLAEGDSPGNMAALHHFSFGMALRNRLGLWKDDSGDLKQSVWDSLTPERQDYYRKWWAGKGDHEGRTMHADDASHEILVAVMSKVEKLP